MHNTAVIFAGGTGSRFSSRTKPKQFLELNGKPIIIHTLESFQNCAEITDIYIVCIESWIERLKDMIDRFRITKVAGIVPGGATGQESIYNGIHAVYNASSDRDDTLVLIHDGVRPLIYESTLRDAIACARKNGSAITVTTATETIITVDDNGSVKDVVDRTHAKLARAPQCYFLNDVVRAQEMAKADNYTEAIDTATLMRHYGYKLYTVEGPVENIKITTPSDYYIFRALLEAQENTQIFGL